MGQEGRNKHGRIPGSCRSKHGYNLTYSRIFALNRWVFHFCIRRAPKEEEGQEVEDMGYKAKQHNTPFR